MKLQYRIQKLTVRFQKQKAYLSGIISRITRLMWYSCEVSTFPRRYHTSHCHKQIISPTLRHHLLTRPQHNCYHKAEYPSEKAHVQSEKEAELMDKDQAISPRLIATSLLCARSAPQELHIVDLILPVYEVQCEPSFAAWTRRKLHLLAQLLRRNHRRPLHDRMRHRWNPRSSNELVSPAHILRQNPKPENPKAWTTISRGRAVPRVDMDCSECGRQSEHTQSFNALESEAVIDANC